MAFFGILLVGLIVAAIAAVAATLWVRRLWKRRSEPPLWTKTVAGLMAAAVLSGAFGTVVGLVKALGAVGVDSVDPSSKARILAKVISGAMNCTAFGLLVGLPTAVALIVLKRRSQHTE